MNDLHERFGSIDIYLFDQVLRGNIRPGQSILDAGCGRGRNLVHFLREGYDVRGFDADPAAVAAARALAPELPDGWRSGGSSSKPCMSPPLAVLSGLLIAAAARVAGAVAAERAAGASPGALARSRSLAATGTTTTEL